MVVPDNTKTELELPKKIEKLCELDDEYMKLERQYQQEWAQLQSKYESKQKVYIDQRTQFLKSDEGKIQGFWLEALKNVPAFEEEIHPHDEDVLMHLINITKEDLPDESGLNQKGFKLVFEWSEENPYFSNKTLTRSFHTVVESEYVNEQTVSAIIMDEDIKWNEGKDVTVEMVTKKPKGKKNQKKKPSAPTEEPRPSFFRTFFRTINLEGGQDPNELEDLIRMNTEELDEADFDDQVSDILDMLKEMGLEQGVMIRDNVIPFAVRWYTGEAMPIMDEDDEEESGDEGEEDGESDEGSDEEA